MLEDGTMQLWIDQVSINQEDKHEKEAQIELMPQIFGRAKEVIGWLGIEGEESDIAMNVLDLFSAGKIARKLGRPRHDTALDYLISRKCLEDPMDIFNPGSTLYQAVMRLVQRPWFQRLWIVQEAVLASDL
jgi:hypothetical protein